MEPLTTRRQCGMAFALVCTVGLAMAHGSKAGGLRIDHLYATPTAAAQTTGAVYLIGIRNTGRTQDRLLSATTPVAQRVEIHRMQLQGDVMQMRAVPALDLPAGASVPLRHGSVNGHHLMLLGLKNPLKDGDRFPVTLTFQRAGEREMMVWVQTPCDGAAPVHSH